jgi:hypothetical protein
LLLESEKSVIVSNSNKDYKTAPSCYRFKPVLPTAKKLAKRFSHGYLNVSDNVLEIISVSSETTNELLTLVLNRANTYKKNYK